ncbi:MAG: AAA-like domain-containing protein [Cyanobacteria bacterium SBLK]|nr:AAA-like domain-containing protein [Cyanobacteria bacterium SBLK]
MGNLTSILLSIVSSVFYDRAKLGISQVIEKRKETLPAVNRDLQKAVQKAYLLATLIVCKVRCQELGIKFPTPPLGRGRHLSVPNAEAGEIVWLDSLAQKIDRERDLLKQPDYSPVDNPDGQADLESCLHLLLTTPDINSNHCLQEIRDSLKKYLIENLKKEHKYVPFRFQEMIEKGWYDRQNNRLDWFELLRDYFIREIKIDPQVSNLFKQYLLSQLVEERIENQLVFENSFQEILNQLVEDRSMFEDILREMQRLPLYQQYLGLEVVDRTEELLAEYAIADAGGQEDILERFDRFIAENRGGLSIVSAPAEAGKTTLLARWIKSRQGRQKFIAYHFFSRHHPSLRKISSAYTHLLRQLCVYHELRNVKFPETEEGLREMLYGFLTQKAIEETEPLIIVLDGLHEAEGEIISLFQFKFPPHLYVIISDRSPEAEPSNDWQQIQPDRFSFPVPITTGKRVLIRYSQSEEANARNLYRCFREAGHQGFLVSDLTRFREDWQDKLQRCDCFVLLLSEESYADDTIALDIEKVRELQASRQDGKPAIVPVSVGNFSLNPEQRILLNQLLPLEGTQPREIVSNILDMLATETLPESVSEIQEEFVVEESVERLPSPVAELELQRMPSSGMSPHSALYVKRSPIEEDCDRSVLQPGALIRIKAARQMGKTSLMSRILAHAKAQGSQVVSLSLQQTESAILMDLDRLLKWFCQQVGHRLGQSHPLSWDSDFGSKDKCSHYFENYLLGELDCPLVVGLDEVDRVFPHESVANDFFGLLRAWHDEAKSVNDTSDLWKKFRLVIVYSTEVYINDIHQSPLFNAGLEIGLPEFNRKQVLDLAQRYQLLWQEDEVVQLMELVGGHPYLVRRALYHLRRKDLTLAELTRSLANQNIYCNHLQRFWRILQNYPELKGALHEVIMADEAIELEQTLAYRLDSMGVIKMERNRVLPRCRLYREYFQDCLR